MSSFFQVHRPDLGERLVGSIYRSEIFCTTDEQRRVAEETILDVDASGHWVARFVSRCHPLRCVPKQVRRFAKRNRPARSALG